MIYWNNQKCFKIIRKNIHYINYNLIKITWYEKYRYLTQMLSNFKPIYFTFNTCTQLQGAQNIIYIILASCVNAMNPTGAGRKPCFKKIYHYGTFIGSGPRIVRAGVLQKQWFGDGSAIFEVLDTQMKYQAHFLFENGWQSLKSQSRPSQSINI